MNENLASGKGGPPQIKESSSKKSSPKHDIMEDADDDEESMDWWTKYFASVDAMIEVKFSRVSCLHLHFQLQHYYVSKQSYRKILLIIRIIMLIRIEHALIIIDISIKYCLLGNETKFA